ncbi:hypothetical protein [uncultured Campylobacter sp.]|uniref:hypothetical protein n=1 Tax=uncultured Campylobacter sp. TaxID=218934 RepID=UPI00263028E1|nr:hypothetical protein [uncultured Campylobacter sp.]
MDENHKTLRAYEPCKQTGTNRRIVNLAAINSKNLTKSVLAKLRDFKEQYLELKIAWAPRFAAFINLAASKRKIAVIQAKFSSKNKPNLKNKTTSLRVP